MELVSGGVVMVVSMCYAVPQFVLGLCLRTPSCPLPQSLYSIEKRDIAVLDRILGTQKHHNFHS